MSVLGRLRARFTRPPVPMEQRRAAPLLGSFALGRQGGVGFYNAALAEDLSVVSACTSLVSSTIAALPALVFAGLPGGNRREAPEHPLAQLITNGVNARMSWAAWMAWSVAQELLQGNSLSVIGRDGNGQVKELWPVPWQNVNVGITAGGELLFDVQNVMAPWASYGERRRYLQSEVLLISARSDDGFLGRSVLSRAPSVIATAASSQAFAEAIGRQGANPSGSISHAGKLNESARTYLAESFAHEHGGAHRARRALILDEGMTFTPYDIKAADQELISNRRFDGEQIARLFNVPPSLIGELSFGSFSNVETAGRFFSTFCIAPHVKRIESAFGMSVFQGDGHHLMLDLAGLQRGDEVGRWATYKIALDAQVLSIDEVRALEGWPPKVTTAGEIVPGAADP